MASAKRAAESDLKNEDLFEHHPTPMWVYDALTNGFLAVNDAALHRYGFSEKEFLQMTLLDIRPAEDVPKFNSTRTNVSLKGFGDAGVWRHKTKSGEMMHMHITLNHTNFRGRDGVFVMAREVTREVESRQTLETLKDSLEERVVQRTAELQSANQELDAFARSAAHDLRTPLNGILGFTQILQYDLTHATVDRQFAALDQIQRSAKSMLGLIEGLLVMSRVAHKSLVIEDVDLSTLASLSIEQLRNANPDQRVDSYVQPGLSVQGDPAMLFSLLSNLLSNAWKYSRNRDEPRIEFGWQILPDSAPAYFVRDNGVGFSIDKAHCLFKPFQRLHHEREFEGNGVGLVTCQRVVLRHGGRIWPMSEIGVGTTIWFTLPTHKSDPKLVER